GKTTLVKGIARGLGITESVTSPTFALIQEYEGALPLYHVDLYRIGSDAEVDDLGLEEYLYGDGVTVIEWPEKAVPFLPDTTITVTISVMDDGGRKIEQKQGAAANDR
ncbi:MAG TPA: tRNA (adenosine(37)-N6)-threonylcarbamoyltransferase complex ATPase subunit type 1 TsaE, partial [Spirochaetia bacterium]|nr:tRNA (adenosine(37)-N6)-threonylcarbamoyltransferase complex ATPase subunit type 1 TsaE [Spirochaetia bacterium]